MIFMGSEKYPCENELSQYVTENGGWSNATTYFERTLFHFDVQQQYFDGALDIFASLFTAPLMLKDAMAREREAVECEYTSKKLDENFRLTQILASLTEPGNPYGRFDCGNLETLKDNISDDELYEKAHEFRRRHYSAHRMHLCLQAR